MGQKICTLKKKVKKCKKTVDLVFLIWFNIEDCKKLCEEIDIPLTDVFDPNNYYTKTEVDNLIPTVPTSNTAFTNDAGYLTEHQPIKTINGQSLIGTGDIEIGTGGTIDLSNYYTTAQTVNLVESAVTRVEGEIPSLSGYATEQWVLDKHYITGVDLSDYATKAEIPVAIPDNIFPKERIDLVTIPNTVVDPNKPLD